MIDYGFIPHMSLRLNVNVPAGERVFGPFSGPHSTKGIALSMLYPLVQVTVIYKQEHQTILILSSLKYNILMDKESKILLIR